MDQSPGRTHPGSLAVYAQQRPAAAGVVSAVVGLGGHLIAATYVQADDLAEAQDEIRWVRPMSDPRIWHVVARAAKLLAVEQPSCVWLGPDRGCYQAVYAC